MECPCQSQKTFEKCCGRFIVNGEFPETAEELMRARYTAYTRVDMAFVEKTHDPKTKKDINMDSNRDWAESTDWRGLEIVETKDGSPDDDRGFVEFIARYDGGDGIEEHHELSEFNRRQGRWYYTDSKNPAVKTVVNENKVGRNDPCPCGSGKKFKKCCG